MADTTFLQPGGQGQNTDVDAASEVLVADQPCIGVRLKALPGNGDVVFYRTGGVTATVINAWPLAAGEETPLLRLNNLNEINVIAGAVDQAIAWEFYV